MKAIVDPALLIKELKKIHPVIGKNQVMPVLGCVKLDFNKSELTVTGTNLNTWVSYKIPCENKSPFVIMVPLDDMIDVCSKAQGPLTVSNEKTVHKFMHDAGSVKLPISANVEDFPDVESVDYFTTIDVSGDFFHAVNGANVCRSRDALMPQMNGICIDFKKTEVTVVGVDGFIMHRQDFPFKIEKFAKISVNTVFADLVKFFQQSSISVSEKFLKAEYGNSVVVTRLSENKYVDYTVPLRNFKRSFNILVDRKEILSKLDVIDIATTRSAKTVLLTFTPGKIHMFTNDMYQDGKEAEAECKASHELSCAVRIKGDMLKSLLGTITEDTIKINIDDPTQNIFIQPEDNDSILLSIMPLMLNDLN